MVQGEAEPSSNRGPFVIYEPTGIPRRGNCGYQRRKRGDRENLIKARLSMLALAEELQNISLGCGRADACRRALAYTRAGICRSRFREVKVFAQ